MKRRYSLIWTDMPSIVRLGAFLVAVMLAFVLFGCATTKPEGVQITVATERVAQCKAAGGCRLLTESEMVSLQVRAYRQGLADAAQAAAELLDSHGCRRGET